MLGQLLSQTRREGQSDSPQYHPATETPTKDRPGLRSMRPAHRQQNTQKIEDHILNACRSPHPGLNNFASDPHRYGEAR